MKYLFLIIISIIAFSQTSLFAQNNTVTRDSNMLISSRSNNLLKAQDERVSVDVPIPSDKALRYYRSGNVLWVINKIWGLLLIPVFFLFTGFSAKIRNWSQKLGRKWFFVIGLYFIIFTVIYFIIDFPLSYYQNFLREHAYDLSSQTFWNWFGDSLKSLMVIIIGGFCFLWIPYLLIKKSPKRWWLYAGFLMVPFMFFALLIFPIWIDPLFIDFGSMKNKDLESKIIALAEKTGIEGSRVFEVNKSSDTKTTNAWVTGFLGTKRIVLYDNLIAQLNEKELLFIMGHEMGHYLLSHDVKFISFFAVLAMIILYAVYRTAGGLINKFKVSFGFDQLSDVASLPLILLLVNIFLILITPIAYSFSRYQEHEADRFGLEITQTNHAAATAFVKFQEDNLINPRPGFLYILWRCTHPTIGDRIEFCNTYHPWQEGKSLKYESYFEK